MDVKGFVLCGAGDALKWPGLCRWVSGVGVWWNTTGISHPLAGGGTLVLGHTWGARSGYVIEGQGRQVIRYTTPVGCEPVRSGQTPTEGFRLGVGGV